MKTTKALIQTAFIYSLLAMAGGVFYREYTKLQGYTGKTNLSVVHTHLFLLGMIFFLIVALFSFHVDLFDQKHYGKFFVIYNIGMSITTAAFLWRGLLQVHQTPLSKGLDASISGIAGLGHICIGAGILLFFNCLKKTTVFK